MGFDAAGARKAGYTDDEIADYLAPRANFDLKAAREAGYESSEILSFLDKMPVKSESDLSSGSLLNSMVRQNEAEQLQTDTQKAAAEEARASTPSRDTGQIKSGIPNNDVLEQLSKEDSAPVVDTENKRSRYFDPEEKSGVLRQAADVPLKVGQGAVMGVRMIADSFGADSAASKALRGAEDYLGDMMSAQSKGDAGRVAEIMKSAEDKGLGAQVRAGLEALTVAPVDLVSQAIGTSAPIIVGSLLAAFAAPVGLGATAAVGAGIGLGAATGAGAVKSSVYDTVRTELMAIGVPQDVATDAAVKAQEYKGDNLDQILLGSLIGGVAGATGVEAAAIRGFIPKLTAKIAAEKTAGGFGKRVAVGAAQEGGTETIQEGQEKVSQNVALQREGFDTPTFQGVASAATLGGTIGAITGGGVSAVSGDGKPASDDGTGARVDEYIQNRDRQLTGEPAAPIAESVTTPGDSAVVVEGAEIPAAQSPQAPLANIINAGSVDEAIAAAAQTSVSSPTSKAPASLDEMIDDTRQMFDEQISNPKQEKLLKLFNGLNSGTIEKAKDGLYEYTTNDGGRFPLQVWAPDPKNPDAGGISPDLAKAQIQHYKQLGVDVVYVRDDQQIPFDGAVDPTQPNTIFLSSNPTRNAAQVAEHELGHVLENVVLPSGESFGDVAVQLIAEGITSEGVDALELFGQNAPDRAAYPSTPEGQAQHADDVLKFLFNELKSDIVGEAPKFTGFVDRVIGEVEKRYGAGVATQTFKKFMDGIRDAIVTLRNFFGKGETQSQKWVTNLEQIHTSIAQAYAGRYGEVQGLPEFKAPVTGPTAEAVIKEAEKTPTRVGPKPREGYETAKKDAEVYKRWLGELDEKRRADADKSPEVAALRAKEKEILGKAKGGEKYLSKTQRERLVKVRAEIDDRVNPKEDNDDMALVRERMVEAQSRMADAASVTKEKTPEAPKAKPASGEPVRIGKPAPRPAETGNPADGDRFVANQRAQDTGGKPQFSPKQINTPEFKKWFGDSKVADEKGKPLVVYHGTASDITSFKQGDGWYGKGIYLTDNPEYASDFATEGSDDGETGANVIPAYVSLQRPFIFREKLNDTASNVQLMKQLGFSEAEINKSFENERDLIRPKLDALGHDGIIVLSAEGRNEYVAFKPEQIKSAIGNSGAFDNKNPRIQFSPKAQDKGPVFFSALERAVDGVKFDKAPPGQWMATIKNMPGIKAEEIKTTGIDKWLAAQTRPVTKAEVIEQVQLGAVKIEEVDKGSGSSRLTPDQAIEAIEGGGDVFFYTAKMGADKAQGPIDADDVAALREEDGAIFVTQDSADETKFGTYVLPGGQNYRELLLTLPSQDKFDPSKVEIDRSELETEGRVRLNYGGERVGSFSIAAKDKTDAQWQDIVRKRFYGDEEMGVRPLAKNTFQSSHWNEKNVLAHIRFDERTGPNGERIMHVAEIQSDWHQKGRREGYADPANEKRLLEEAKAATDEMYALRDKMIVKATGGKYTNKTEAIDAADMEAYKAIVAVDAQPEMLAAVDKHNAATEKYRAAKSGVPDAPFKTTWHELAFKRALRYAVENGYDVLTWDTGDTNNDRYDLSQSVKKISWGKNKAGTYFLSIRLQKEDEDGNNSITRDNQTKEQIAELLGKDIAEDIASGKSANDTAPVGDMVQFGEISGDGLKVGGQGMRGFYDKILPDFVNKYVKKWGAKVERGTVGSPISDAAFAKGHPIKLNAETDGSGEYYLSWRESGDRIPGTYRTEKEATDAAVELVKTAGSTPAHSLVITPAMRKDVMAGQPQFSPKKKPTAKDLQKEVPGLKKVVSNMTPEEMQDISKRTVTQLVDAFNNLPSADEYAAVAYSGRAKRGWYKHSAQAIVDVFGQEDGNRFTALLAALSPQTSVESNLENALRTWVNWVKADRPQDPKAIGRILGQSVQGNKGENSVLDAWRGNSIRALTDADPGRPDFMLSGPKVSSFAKNLRNGVDEVTNDAWMATFAAVEAEAFAARRLENKRDTIGKSFGFKSVGYVAASAKVREAAKILTRKTGQTWTPAEVQETVWSWAKTLYERRDRAGEYRTMEQILNAADLTHEDITGTPDFAVLLTQGIYRKILEGGKYDEALQALERTRGGDSNAGRPSGPSISVAGAEGSGFAPAAYERHLRNAARRLERTFVDRRAVDGVNPRDLISDARDSEIAANMSAATNTIPGIARLVESANAGNEYDARTVNLIAHESLERLVATVPDAKLEVSRNGGLYGGALEPSLGVKITFPEKRRAGVLAALAKFASNFNQEQIHVRQPTLDPAGRVSTDGSYATDVYTFKLDAPLSRSEIEEVIAESGLYGLNFSDKALQAYFVGDPRNDAARAEFHAAADRARTALGERARSVDHSVERLWAYGNGEGATQGYDAINGDVPRGTSEYTEIPRAIAERDLGHEIEVSDQADEITEAQRLLQARIADHYEQLPDNDMANPDVRRAYEELSKEIQKQFAALPVKVDVWDQAGEPYKTSADMRRDVLDNNHMWIFGTSTDTFGPPGADFTGHPLLELTGRQSDNGYPLFVNDELRAVHDYYAHMLSPATFGPRGEEAAWKNHLATIDNPWARWALTSETRGQNSWVNFGAHVDPSSKLSERPFARQKAALLPMEHMLTGNDAIDGPTYEFMRTHDYAQNGSLPRSVNDPFADFSPRVPSSLREKLIRKDPAYKAMFNDGPKKQVAIGPLKTTPVAEEPKKVVELPLPNDDKQPRRKALQPIDGTGNDRFRAINGALYSVGEEAPQLERAARLVADDPEKALRIAMLEDRAPAGVHPEFVFMALEEAAMISGDVALQERLSRSRIAEEATTMGQRIAAWRNRAELSPVDDMRKINAAREARAKAKGIDPAAQIDREIERAVTASRRTAKSTKRPSLNELILSMVCRT